MEPLPPGRTMRKQCGSTSALPRGNDKRCGGTILLLPAAPAFCYAVILMPVFLLWVSSYVYE